MIEEYIEFPEIGSEPWRESAVREHYGIESVWFANPADGIKSDDFQPEVPADHPLRDFTLCHLVMDDGGLITGTWLGIDDEAVACAWADAVAQI
jgi:hypothetical protein